MFPAGNCRSFTSISALLSVPASFHLTYISPSAAARVSFFLLMLSHHLFLLVHRQYAPPQPTHPPTRTPSISFTPPPSFLSKRLIDFFFQSTLLLIFSSRSRSNHQHQVTSPTQRTRTLAHVYMQMVLSSISRFGLGVFLMFLLSPRGQPKATPAPRPGCSMFAMYFFS